LLLRLQMDRPETPNGRRMVLSEIAAFVERAASELDKAAQLLAKMRAPHD
jgi:hypothetical protein